MIVEIIRDPDRDETSLQEVFTIVQRHDGIAYALNMAQTYIEAGKSQLEVFSDSSPRRDLMVLADYVVKRKF